MKETFCGLIDLGGFADSATPCDRVRRAIGWVSAGGWSRCVSMGGAVIVVGGSLSTLGSCWGSALTLGVDSGVSTLGGGAGADGAVVCCWIAGGSWMLEKMARRLLIARSCLSILVGEQSALMAVVRALRQWMMRSSAVKTGRLSVWCRKMTVSDTTIACVLLRRRV
jgi:hypothetical protein